MVSPVVPSNIVSYALGEPGVVLILCEKAFTIPVSAHNSLFLPAFKYWKRPFFAAMMEGSSPFAPYTYTTGFNANPLHIGKHLRNLQVAALKVIKWTRKFLLQGIIIWQVLFHHLFYLGVRSGCVLVLSRVRVHREHLGIMSVLHVGLGTHMLAVKIMGIGDSKCMQRI